jgi:hypothetical protein
MSENNVVKEPEDNHTTKPALPNKKKWGQFYTTNHEYILQNMSIPDDITEIVEPFTGNGNLLDFIDKKNTVLNVMILNPKTNIQFNKTLY